MPLSLKLGSSRLHLLGVPLSMCILNVGELRMHEGSLKIFLYEVLSLRIQWLQDMLSMELENRHSNYFDKWNWQVDWCSKGAKHDERPGCEDTSAKQSTEPQVFLSVLQLSPLSDANFQFFQVSLEIWPHAYFVPVDIFHPKRLNKNNVVACWDKCHVCGI